MSDIIKLADDPETVLRLARMVYGIQSTIYLTGARNVPADYPQHINPATLDAEALKSEIALVVGVLCGCSAEEIHGAQSKATEDAAVVIGLLPCRVVPYSKQSDEYRKTHSINRHAVEIAARMIAHAIELEATA